MPGPPPVRPSLWFGLTLGVLVAIAVHLIARDYLSFSDKGPDSPINTELQADIIGFLAGTVIGTLLAPRTPR